MGQREKQRAREHMEKSGKKYNQMLTAVFS